MLITISYVHDLFSGKGVRYGNVVTGLGVAPYSALRLEKTEINDPTQQKQYILYPEPNMFVLSALSFQSRSEMCCSAIAPISLCCPTP